jgi:hypothetical protein
VVSAVVSEVVLLEWCRLLYGVGNGGLCRQWIDRRNATQRLLLTGLDEGVNRAQYCNVGCRLLVLAVVVLVSAVVDRRIVF